MRPSALCPTKRGHQVPIAILLLCAVMCRAEVIVESGASKLFTINSSGRLAYNTDAKGNRLPDFSYSGYHSCEKPIPTANVAMSLEPTGGDDTELIQRAIIAVGKRRIGSNGLRGAILLRRGIYKVSGTININYSGIVLRGEGCDKDGTLIIATGYGDKSYKRTLISVGNSEKIKLDDLSKQPITDTYVPIGAQSFSVKSAAKYKVGDRIAVNRPATAEWISLIGCDKLKPKWQKDKNGKKIDATVQWSPSRYNLYFERKITDIKGDTIYIDAPIVQPIDEKFGGGSIFHYSTDNRITEVGIENMRLISEFAKATPGNPYGDSKSESSSELHAWHGIRLERNTENTWVRNITGNYFGWSLVSAHGNKATVQDCLNLGHASKIAGGRRYSFMINGQMNLMQRCVSYKGRHEFVTQATTCGPNAFVDCIGIDSKSCAGPHHRYSVGNLFDNVRSEQYMESRFRGNSGTGHGWAGTQTCFYNCIAPSFKVGAPPGGVSWVLGCTGEYSSEKRLKPDSLFYQQVRDRLGEKAVLHLTSSDHLASLGRYTWHRKAK